MTKVADTVKKRIDPRSFMTEEILIAFMIPSGVNSTCEAALLSFSFPAYAPPYEYFIQPYNLLL